MKASEVLADALAFWGQGGERWIQHDIGDTQRACLVGGIGVGATGKPCYLAEAVEVREMYGAYSKAMAYIYDELEARDMLNDFSDSASPRDLRLNSEHRQMPSFVSEALIVFNDYGATTFEELRGVVCGALQRALKDEETGDAKA